jgi:hypothetical protein
VDSQSLNGPDFVDPIEIKFHLLYQNNSMQYKAEISTAKPMLNKNFSAVKPKIPRKLCGSTKYTVRTMN